MTPAEAAILWQQAALHHDRCKREFLAAAPAGVEHAAARLSSASNALAGASYRYEQAVRDAVEVTGR